jgi:hypothetical protein
MQIPIEQFRERMQALFFNEQVLDFVATEVTDNVKEWYTDLPENWFDNPDPFPDGTPRHAGARSWMYPLSESWEYELQQNGFSVNFKHSKAKDGSSTSNWGLRLQQYGGWIRPVKKKALTIPVTADARGKTVREFQTTYGRKLFKVGKNDGQKLGTLVWEDPAGELHAAYVLRKSSYVKPLKQRRGHDAIPSGQQLQDWAAKAYQTFLNNIEHFSSFHA